MRPLIIAAAATLAMTQFASAQTTTPPKHDMQNLRQEVQANLKNGGFTNIKVMPESFLVRAKDKSGNPVMMFISPDSMSEVTAMKTNRSAASGEFMTVPSTDKLSSNVVGLNVYNDKNQDIGTIKDIAVNQDGVRAYIVGVGGFLGMGDHYVAVNPSALDLTYNQSAKTWHATMNATADQLKAAPKFTYSGAWSPSKA